MGQRAALYCRVSTADQSCARQERDLDAFAERAGYEVVGTYKETASGVKLDRAERRKVLALVAQGRSYRLVGREVGLSKNTVADIVKRNRAAQLLLALMCLAVCSVNVGERRNQPAWVAASQAGPCELPGSQARHWRSCCKTCWT